MQLARLLTEDATHRIFLAVLNDEGVLRAEVEKFGFSEIPAFPLNSFYDLNFLKQIRKCARFLRENKIDVLHTHDFYTNVFGIAAARLAGVSAKIASKRETGGMRSKSQQLIEKRIFRLADAIVVNAKAVENYLFEAGVSKDKTKVVYNGLDLERLQSKLTDRAEICKELNLPTGENIKFITLVANLRHAVKNQPMFLRAAFRVLEKFPESHFILAGEGELRSSLESFAGELKIKANVHFTGRCERVPELLSVSFAGVLTSFHEGFSNSILEYMAARLPVVATDVGGASEAIVENETGFLVASDDDAALADRLMKLLADEEKAAKFGERARKTVEEKFSLRSQLTETLELYKSFD